MENGQTDTRSNILRELKICRFCLTNDESVLSNIYEKHPADAKNSTPLPLQIMACVAIEVFKNDGMPQLICNACRNNTMHAYTFKSNCKRADDSLKVFLATGQLAKPYFPKANQIKIVPKQPHQLVIVEEPKKQHQQKPQGNASKIDSVSESIISENSNDDTQNMSIDENSQANDCIEVEMDDSMQSAEDNAYSSQDENSNSGHKVKKVPTDCFSCPHCERTFPLKQLLDLHLPMHKREREFECGTCFKKFYNKYDLARHFMTHSSEKNHPCSACNKSFATETLLKRHEKVHSDVPKFFCELCNRQFLNKQVLDLHMEKHKKKRPFTCNVCNKSFVFKQGLERHATVHSDNKPHKCNYCEASFTTAIKLTRHITSHAGLRPYPCKICNRTFLLSHHLTRHMRSHNAIKNFTPEVIINRYKCDICSMSFKRKDTLTNHSAIHSMVNLRCVICNTSFETAQMVKEHIDTHLTGLPYPCEKCDYSFETSTQLEEHELKHAEMEYEEQIEKEVISEALQKDHIDFDLMDDNEVEEYTIPDFDNPDVVPARSSQYEHDDENDSNIIQLNTEHQPEEQTTETQEDEIYTKFWKGIEDNEENDEDVDTSKSDTGENRSECEIIKPIVRHEGTKVYQRKSSSEKKRTDAHQSTSIRLSSLQNTTKAITKQPTVLSQSLLKAGEKPVKVQKFIIAKDEIKAMAKQGILKIKNGQVVVKNSSQLNAILKPLQGNEIDTLLERKEETSKMQPVKQYSQKRVSDTQPHNSSSSSTMSQRTTEDIDLDVAFNDLSETTLNSTLD